MKIMKLKNGQFLVTVPTWVINSLKLKKGYDVEWITHMGNIIFRKKEATHGD